PPANGSQSIVSAYRTPGFGPNWAIFLLPYVEQMPLYQSIDVNSYMGSAGADQSWRTLRDKSVPVYICPADPGAANLGFFALNGGSWARGNYAANAGAGWFNWTLDGASHDGGATGGKVTNNVGGPFGINWG